jgi:UDP:flavonoid glycosyltransferase YjiC (YdhE family)
MKVLFVNELGRGYGNVGPLVRMAKRLAAFGVKPVYALGDPVTPAAVLVEAAGPVLSAPSHPEPLRPKAGPATYGDILACYGFGALPELRSLVSSWDALFDLVKPAFVVASHAPTAILAARGRYAVAAVGTGFTLPPASMPVFPALRPDTASFRPEFQVLQTVNALLAERGEAGLPCLPRLLAVKARLVETIGVLDPYVAVRDDPYVALSPPAGPFEPLGVHAGIFATLDMRGKEAAATVEALGLLAEGLPVEAHLRGPGAAAAMRFLARRGAVVHERPATMPEALNRTRVVVSQGGHGLSLLATRAGRPQVILPQHFEAMLNGVALERVGAAKVAWGGGRDTVLEHIDWALADGALGAGRLSQELEPQAQWDVERFIVAFGGKVQRRKSPSDAKPKRGQRSQGSRGGVTPAGANFSTPAAKPAA